MSSFVPSAIIQPFFGILAPDFAWKFVLTVQTNKAKLANYIITQLVNYSITQKFIELQTPDFAWNFVLTI